MKKVVDAREMLKAVKAMGEVFKDTKITVVLPKTYDKFLSEYLSALALLKKAECYECLRLDAWCVDCRAAYKKETN